MPAPRGPLFGREADLDHLVSLLTDRERPVLTLTGPGGVGKTSLAQAVAGRVAADFPGGVTFVDLAGTTDPSAVLPALASALGVPEEAGQGPNALAPYLADRRLLLVLDNLEQVLDCAPHLAELVVRCPDLVLLTTSRAPLRIRSEREVRVEPLGEEDAVRLFLERANAAGAELRPGDHTDAIAALCREADGLPLAIELSASAASSLGVDALRDRVLTAGADGLRDLPARQRSMEATLDWSIDLLDPDAVEVLGLLSVLTGGFSLGAAAAVSGREVLAEVRTLREHSLLTRVDDVAGEARFRLLEPVRQYAGRRWDTSEPAVAGLATYVVETARELAPCATRLERRHRPGPPRLRHRAGPELAWSGSSSSGRFDEVASVLVDCWLYLALRGRAQEGRAWIEALRDQTMSDVSRARWLVASAGLHNLMGEAAPARRDAEAALALVHASGPAELVAEASVLAGMGAVFAGDVEGAARLLDRGEGVVDPDRMPWLAAHLRIARGQAALVSGDVVQAETLLREAEEQARSLGNPFTLATTLNVLANVTELRDDHASSAALLAEAVELSAEGAMGWTLAYSLPALAGVAVRVGAARDRRPPLRCLGVLLRPARRRDVVPDDAGAGRARPHRGPVRAGRGRLPRGVGRRPGRDCGRRRRPGPGPQAARTRVM